MCYLNLAFIINYKVASNVLSPQQNGVVERKYRHLLQITRSLLFQSKLPAKFWGEGILHAAFIINISPTKLLNWKTPYEVLHQKPPDYSLLKNFGCLCYATDVHPHKDKLSPRAIESIFLGFHSGMKAYKLYDLSTKKTFMCRDLCFKENVYPFKSADGSSTIALPIVAPDDPTEL